jgi:hypothetical protein
MIEVESPLEMGSRMPCPVCRVELEVVWLYPVELDLPEEGPLHRDRNDVEKIQPNLGDSYGF